jgi:hypothetical protein
MLADYERAIALKNAIIDARDKEIGHLHQTIVQLDEDPSRFRSDCYRTPSAGASAAALVCSIGPTKTDP